jgi:hypothetical protein
VDAFDFGLDFKFTVFKNRRLVFGDETNDEDDDNKVTPESWNHHHPPPPPEQKHVQIRLQEEQAVNVKESL